MNDSQNQGIDCPLKSNETFAWARRLFKSQMRDEEAVRIRVRLITNASEAGKRQSVAAGGHFETIGE